MQALSVLKPSALAIAALLAPATTLAQSVTLTEKSIPQGTVFNVKSEMNFDKSTINMSQGGQNMQMEMSMRQFEDATITITGNDGQKVTSYDHKVNDAGQVQEMVMMGQPQTQKMGDDLVGITVPFERQGDKFEPGPMPQATPMQQEAAKSLSTMLFNQDILPDKPVQVGESWEPNLDNMFDAASGMTDAKATATLKDLKMVNGQQVAVIGLEMDFSGSDPSMGGAKVEMSLKGDMQHLVDLGVTQAMEATGTMKMSGGGQGMTLNAEFPVTMTMNMTQGDAAPANRGGSGGNSSGGGNPLGGGGNSGGGGGGERSGGLFNR
jgi:hypothetical protein